MSVAAHTFTSFLAATTLVRNMKQLDDHPPPAHLQVNTSTDSCDHFARTLVEAYQDVNAVVRYTVQNLKDLPCHERLLQELPSYKALLEAARQLTVDPIRETMYTGDDEEFDKWEYAMPTVEQYDKLSVAAGKLWALRENCDTEKRLPGWRYAVHEFSSRVTAANPRLSQRTGEVTPAPAGSTPATSGKGKKSAEDIMKSMAIQEPAGQDDTKLNKVAYVMIRFLLPLPYFL